MRKIYTKRIYPSVEGIRNAIRVLGTTNEKFRALKAEDLVDYRFGGSWRRKVCFRSLVLESKSRHPVI
jgi:hypothetical protein